MPLDAIRKGATILAEHDVTLVASGRDAISAIERRDFDIVLCDLIMPELTGMDVFEYALERRPELGSRFVFRTGAAFTSRARDFIEHRTDVLLSKPFNETELRHAIARTRRAASMARSPRARPRFGNSERAGRLRRRENVAPVLDEHRTSVYSDAVVKRPASSRLPLMFGPHPFSNRTRGITTFTLGLILGVVAPNAISLASRESAQIERVAGNDGPAAAQRSARPVSNPRAIGQSGAPSLADPPPPLVPNLQNGAGGIARRNEDSAKAGQQPSARDIAERALGFTAFIRRGPLYGAGILLDSAGHVLTCRHVIEGEDRISISFHDTGPFIADVVDTDEKLDLALLHIDSRRATPAQVAPIFTVSTGDDVFGMGAPHKLRFSMSRGLVSYVGRPFDELYYLQTDLPTNSGNSGGPVMNDRGEVVGITTFIFRDSQGLAFALPIDYAFDRFKHLLGSSALDGNRFSAWRETAKQHARSGG